MDIDADKRRGSAMNTIVIKTRWDTEVISEALNRAGVKDFSIEMNKRDVPYRSLMYVDKPWLRPVRNIKDKIRKGAGYKMTLVEGELKVLWDRDRAGTFSRPALTRKNTRGDFSYDNVLWFDMGMSGERS